MLQEQVHQWVLELHNQCESTITAVERKEQQKYATLIRNPGDKAFLSKMLDESSQIRDDARLAKRIKRIIDKYGVPKFFNLGDTTLLRMYQYGAYHLSWPSIDIIKKRLRNDTNGIIIDAARPTLTNHLKARYDAHIGQNINLLGEVVLGNNEADHRYYHYLEALEQPDINYISIKISGIYAQLHPLNFKLAKAELIHRLATIFRKAIAFPYISPDGSSQPKFVNLDMEEYKDANLTLHVFKETLSQEEFKNYTAGIAIQAYLQDAAMLQQELLDFAKERVANGGAPLKMRLVKGANQQTETITSAIKGWPSPIRKSKVEVDADYLHLIDIALQPENAKALKLGVASHNLFSIAYAHLRAEELGTSDFVTFEMLEGMANHLWRTMAKLGKQVILYTPVVSEENFLNAVSYLVRRLDENTGHDNFLSYSFNLHPNTPEWTFLAEQFNTAFAMKDKVETFQTRIQDRNEPYVSPYGEMFSVEQFRNEPDTDFDLPQNQRWAKSIVAKWKKAPDNEPIQILVQQGNYQKDADRYYDYKDHCQEDVTVYRMGMASPAQVSSILQAAEADASQWRSTTMAHRRETLHRAADLLSSRRGDLIGAMCAVTGKTITEGDIEVSEAVDFARYYPLTMQKFEELSTVKTSPKGVVLVISPWNFPLAIPVGGISSALSAGNSVILKPATVAAPIAWEFAQAFWDAGVPKDALQVVITNGLEPLELLTKSSVIKHIILTGSTDTAQRLQMVNPRVALSAETGGKNAIILSAGGDRDKAIMNVVSSAFSNAGQKCSACSLFLVERSIFDDPTFKVKLRDAATSMQAGSVWHFNNLVGPMITDRNDKLIHSLEVMEQDEEWLVAPEWLDDYTLRPTVKWNVWPGSYCFKNELFAPMLSVVPFDSLSEAIEMVNSLDYGLTSGLQSLDEEEQEIWRDTVQAGNLYINRGITGAVVNRQPFGGMKLSAFGQGAKAGGPNYVATLANFQPISLNDNFQKVFNDEFGTPKDVNKLPGEQNILRYLPVENIVLRVFANDNLEEIKLIAKAAYVCRTALTISIDEQHPLMDSVTQLGCAVEGQTLEEFIRTLGQWERIRTCSDDLPLELYVAAAVHCKYIATSRAVSEGRIELLHYLKEQSISFEYHRYGSIIEVPTIS